MVASDGLVGPRRSAVLHITKIMVRIYENVAEVQPLKVGMALETGAPVLKHPQMRSLPGGRTLAETFFQERIWWHHCSPPIGLGSL